MSFDLQRFAVNKVPEMISEARVYWNGEDNMIGIASVDLPELSAMTTSITGVGVMGEIDAPVKGHFQGMEMTLNWRTPHINGLRMSGGRAVALEIYSNIQNFDSGANEYVDDKLRVVVRGRGKTYAPGTQEAGNTSDSSNTIEVHYLKIEINDIEVIELDKYGYKYAIDGEDMLATVRKNIGLS